MSRDREEPDRPEETLPDELDVVWYVVVSRHDEETPTDEAHDAHKRWLRERHRAGQIILSGPTVDRRAGLYIASASDVAEARRIVAADPFHQRGFRKGEVIPWSVRRFGRLAGPSVRELIALATGSESGGGPHRSPGTSLGEVR